MTGVEDTIAKLLIQTFGSAEVLGIVSIMALTIIIVAMKPPEAVAITAVGLVILLVAGPYLGGLGLLPTLFMGIVIGAIILYYLASKRIVRDY